jgi:hypothetical protein
LQFSLPTSCNSKIDFYFYKSQFFKKAHDFV